jgi:hypothetical protein
VKEGEREDRKVVRAEARWAADKVVEQVGTTGVGERGCSCVRIKTARSVLRAPLGVRDDCGEVALNRRVRAAKTPGSAELKPSTTMGGGKTRRSRHEPRKACTT